MTTLQIPDQQAAALQARAAAEGLTLEAWLAKLAGVEDKVSRRRYRLDELIRECDPAPDVPPPVQGQANQRMSLVEVLSFLRTSGLIGPDFVIERERTHAEPADL
ncbi:MAG: hypothetical protein NTZ56_20160 [Acidobacteria bacterium]|nr:hypothetical protein [Acidobacteriota bacterium]